jgi:hypothetical protein
MTISTWKAEFYLVLARNAKDPEAHSLQKWVGLRKENLDKHGLKADCNRLHGKDVGMFTLGSENCALCETYYDDGSHTPCVDCPLCKHLGYACDSVKVEDAPWRVFTVQGNPEPMIAALMAIQKDPK